MPIKTIRIRKAGGGTRLQKVEVLKSGKYKFVKNTRKAKRKTTTRKRRTTRARKGEKTLSGRQAYPRTVRRRAAKRKSKDSDWSW